MHVVHRTGEGAPVFGTGSGMDEEMDAVKAEGGEKVGVHPLSCGRRAVKVEECIDG